MIPKKSLPFTVTEDEVWYFITERQNIFHRRFELKEDPLWTSDEILQRYHFCNVYRRLDKGSQWAMRNIVEPDRDDLVNMLWKTLIYRRCNRPETFEAVGIPAWQEFDYVKWGEELYRYREEGNAVFSPAYQPHKIKGEDTIVAYLVVLYQVHNRLQELFRAMRSAPTLESACSVLTTVKGIAGFISYQVLADLLYSDVFFPNFSQDHWVDIGPGCADGLWHLHGSLSEAEQYARLKDMWSRQEEMLGKGFPYWQGRPIGLGDFQNCLCETSKYWRLKAGRGRKRKFRPQSDASLYSSS